MNNISKLHKNPENIETLIPFLDELKNKYNYLEEDLIYKPQYVIHSPSKNVNYPIDIAIFDNNKLKIIVECKRNKTNEGIEQLKKYLNLCEAEYGIWTNGKERKIFKKIYKDNKISEYKEVFYILPKGIFSEKRPKKKDLLKIDNLKEIFKKIHHYIATREVGSTLSFTIVENFIRVLFCKIYEERYLEEEEFLEFYSLENENKEIISNRIKNLFEKVKNTYKDIFKTTEKINFSDEIIYYIVNQLKDFSLLNCNRDVIADAFEAFIGNTLKGEHGQFFTPRNVINFIIKYLNKNFLKIKSNLKVIDPACGTGGFLVEVLNFVKNSINNSNKTLETKIEEQNRFFNNNLFGIDKDSFVSKITKTYMCILSNGFSNIFEKDSLKIFKEKPDLKESFDLIITNPPFGKSIKIEENDIIKNYILSNGKKVNPEILFIELCVNLLKENGIMTLVLPEGIFVNQQSKYIREFLMSKGKILSIISLPTETFQPYTAIKTSILIFQKGKFNEENYLVNFTKINKVGYDKKGKTLYKLNSKGDFVLENKNKVIDNDFETILNEENNLTILVNSEKIKNNRFILNYDFYNKTTDNLENKYQVFTIRELIDNGVLEKTKNNLLPSGKGINSQNYLEKKEKDSIPFIRTSDIKNLEIVRNPQKWVSKEFFNKQKKILNVNDILFVKDGKHCVGETTLLSKGEENILLQSHIYILRVKENNFGISPFNLLGALNNQKTINEIKQLIFTQGTIPTIGENIYDVKLYFDKSKTKLLKESEEWKEFIDTRYKLKNKIIREW